MGPDHKVGCYYGSWAHAYLSNKAGTDVLIGSFYKNLNNLGWGGAFIQTYGKTSAESLEEFDTFLELPIADQLRILP